LGEGAEEKKYWIRKEQKKNDCEREKLVDRLRFIGLRGFSRIVKMGKKGKFYRRDRGERREEKVKKIRHGLTLDLHGLLK